MTYSNRESIFDRESMAEISNRLDPSPKKDAGHYVEAPLTESSRCLEVADGQIVRCAYVLTGNGSAAGSDSLKRLGEYAGKQGGCAVQVCSELPFDCVRLGADATADIVVLIFPDSVQNMDVSLAVDIAGKNANANLSGLYICDGDSKLNVLTEIRHRVPYCLSNEIFNGIVAGNSNARFYGKIVVAPDAQKTEAYQSNHNIVLSDNAHAEAKPQLEIYADDVKCSHGATVGQLNEDEQFYMRSRGIPEDEAKVLQMISFIAPVLAHIEDVTLRTLLYDVVEFAVRGL